MKRPGARVLSSLQEKSVALQKNPRIHVPDLHALIDDLPEDRM